MKQINLIYGIDRAFTKYCGFDSCDKKRVPVFFMLGKKKCFIFNLTTEIYNDRSGWGKYRIEESKEELKNYVDQLTNNDGKYFCFHSKQKDVWEFLKWVKESGYTFRDSTAFHLCNGCFEFHGNLNEYSCGFMYRIYDKRLYDQLRKRLPDIQVRDMRA